MQITCADLFDLTHTRHLELFEDCEHPWTVLKRLSEYIKTHLAPIQQHRTVGRAYIGETVQIGEGTVVEDGAMILGPAIIGRNCQIRHNAYIRENVVIGDGCVIGNSCEIKHSVLLNDVQVPHFNYVGDSVLGNKAHLGAGAIVSNVKLDRKNIWINLDGTPVDTGLRKFGALIGDETEVGCNSVLNPGSILGKGCLIYAGVSWRGILPNYMLVKNTTELQVSVRRPRTT
jgi:NDP-sugar pyrophosphorylase family protein